MLYIDRTRCTGCAACSDVCPTGAIRLDEDGHVATIDLALCNECQACLDVCPNDALQWVESHELVSVGDNEIVEGQVVGDMVPLVATRQPSRLAALAGTALSFVGGWLLPRTADALVDAIERRLTRGTNPVSSGTPLSSGRRSLIGQMGNGTRKGGRQRRRRRRSR